MKYSYEGMVGLREIKAKIASLEATTEDQRNTRGAIRESVDEKHPDQISVVVERIESVTKTTKCIRLVPKTGALPYFRAGQFINVKVNVGGIETSRAYSVSSAPADRNYYEITVRGKKDGFVADYLLNDLNVGDELIILPPDGNFYYNSVVHGNDLVFLAGGSGITPFISVLRQFAAQRDYAKSIHLFYGCADQSDVIYEEELHRLEQQLPNFTMHLVISDPEEGYSGLTGFLSADLLKQVLGTVEGRTFFVCGPEAMYKFVIPELVKMGVAEHRICTEVQTPPADPTKLPGWPADVTGETTVTVTIEGGASFAVSATEPLICSLERNHVVLPSRCRAGECAFCRTKLVEGKVFYPQTVKLRKADVAYGYIHPCMTYPISDIVLRLPG